MNHEDGSRRKAIVLVLAHWLGAFALGLVVCSFFWDSLAAFHKDIRGSVFSGFLTLGSFLLTTKTFVITRLQDGLFHTAEYDEKYRTAVQQLGPEKVGARNEGLRRLTEFLVWSVFSCMVVAVGQLALSSCQSNWASAVALSSAIASLFLVLRSWFYMRGFMHEYLVLADSRPIAKPKG